MTGNLWIFDSRNPHPDCADTRRRTRTTGAKARTLCMAALLFLVQLIVQGARAACSDPTTLTPPADPADYTYSIGGGPYQWTVPAWTQGTDCTFTETLTMTPTPSWISITGRVIKVLTTDVSLHNTST